MEQCIHVAVEAVRGEVGGGNALDAKGANQQLGTMVAAAQGHAVAVKMAADFRGGERVDGK